MTIEEIGRRYQAFYSGLVYDQLDERGLGDLVLANNIKPLKYFMIFWIIFLVRIYECIICFFPDFLVLALKRLPEKVNINCLVLNPFRKE